MADSVNCCVKLLYNLFIFYSIAGFIFCNELDRCPRNLPRDRYLRVHRDKCYRFETREVSWTSARDTCRRAGGELITIRRRDIQIFVEQTMSQIWSKNGMWIGAHDRDSEMDWFWVTGERTKSGFQNWDRGQPSCFLLKFMCHEDCACLRKDEGYKWHDYLCSSSMYEYGYACQFNLLPPPPTTTTSTTIKTTTTTSTTRKATTTTTEPITVTKLLPTAEITVGNMIKVLTTVSDVEPSTVSNDSIWIGPGKMINVESQRLSKEESNLNTVGLVVGFVLVFIVGLAVGTFFCRRKYRKRYEESLNVGFNNVLYTAAPVHETQRKVKDTNTLTLSAAAAGDCTSDDEDDHKYVDIDEVAVGGKCVELPPCKDINRPVVVACVKENIYDTVTTHEEAGHDHDMGGACSEDAPPLCPGGHVKQFAPEFLKKDTDVSQAYSNNLYGYNK
ncbi:uncharacterized protein LOC132725433 [Ruditapes philippinarum]|uniref:uncharacterized protein LOC132725433 n=1 Tax=Ruditapes philippinarum TaxID=129788 RepID=UPI00295BBC35|nr:uncharacterized protein LOC132725433 [Ruditapes philippinarum]